MGEPGNEAIYATLQWQHTRILTPTLFQPIVHTELFLNCCVLCTGPEMVASLSHNSMATDKQIQYIHVIYHNIGIPTAYMKDTYS